MTAVEDLIPESPTTHGEYTYTARRNARPEPDGSWRWQVFRDGTFSPLGFIQSHPCPFFDGQIRFLVLDPGSRPLSAPKPGRDDGCVGSYDAALAWFRLEFLHSLDGMAATLTAAGFVVSGRIVDLDHEWYPGLVVHDRAGSTNSDVTLMWTGREYKARASHGSNDYVGSDLVDLVRSTLRRGH